MQYKCDFCQDTGSTNPHADLLDCIHCDATTGRIALDQWLAEQYKQRGMARTDSVAAWAIHQRALAMAPKQEAPTQQPVAWLVYAEGHNGMAPQHPAYATHLHATRCASMFGQTPTEVRPLYDHAAPAAANGAMPEPTMINGRFYYTAEQMRAAAGPDAALVKALEKIARWHGEFPDVPNFDGTTMSYASAYGSQGERDYMRQVALDVLSGAKGN